MNNTTRGIYDNEISLFIEEYKNLYTKTETSFINQSLLNTDEFEVIFINSIIYIIVKTSFIKTFGTESKCLDGGYDIRRQLYTVRDKNDIETTPNMLYIVRNINRKVRSITAYTKQNKIYVKKTCNYCKVLQENIMYCSCKVAYCNTICQKLDWKNHRKIFNHSD